MYEEREERPPRRRRSMGRMRRVFLTLGACVRFVGEKVRGDFMQVFREWRLFGGTTLALVGLLSFTSDRYCDGTTSSYAACTRPATYYYYPWWAIFMVVVGVMLATIWVLRHKKT